MLRRKSFCLIAFCIFASAMAYGANSDQASNKGNEEEAIGPKFQQIDLNSLEMTGFFSPKPVKIKGYLLKAKKDGPAPAAVLAPACNGLLLPKSKKIRPYYRNMAKFLNDGGMTVLLVDGFNPRGHEEICTEPGKSRTIDTEVRMKDIIGGLYYMRSSPDVLGNKIFLVTWGATGSLQVMNKESPYYDKIHPGFAGAIMFYPECAHMDNRFAPYAPIQMYVGELDTWNPAAACKALAKRQEPGSASFNIKIYPKTYHAFDQMREPALRTDLAVGPVIIGGNPESAADAYKTTAEFLSKFIEFSNVPVQGAK